MICLRTEQIEHISIHIIRDPSNDINVGMGVVETWTDPTLNFNSALQ